jgi:hypothetical protein
MDRGTAALPKIPEARPLASQPKAAKASRRGHTPTEGLHISMASRALFTAAVVPAAPPWDPP